MSFVERIECESSGIGLCEITDAVQDAVGRARVDQGLCTVFIAHTSASLVIQENADPSAARDLERWFERLVVEEDPLYTHTAEGSDDMPAHIRSALTDTSVAIPILEGRLALGTWQGIFLFEHRRGRHRRKVVIHVAG